MCVPRDGQDKGIYCLFSQVSLHLNETAVRKSGAFIDFSKVSMEQGEEKVLTQHHGLQFCGVRQHRQLSCHRRRTLLV